MKKKDIKTIIILVLLMLAMISPIFNKLLIEGIFKIFLNIIISLYIIVYGSKSKNKYKYIIACLSVIASFNFVRHNDIFNIFLLLNILNLFNELDDVPYLTGLATIILIINIYMLYSYDVISSDYLNIFIMKLFVIFIFFIINFKNILYVLFNNKTINNEMFLLINMVVITFILQFVYPSSQIFLAVFIGLLMTKTRSNKIMFISSTGGHLNELLQLKPLMNKYNSILVTEKTKTTKDIDGIKTYYLVFGTKDYILTYPFKFIYNSIKSLFLYFIIKPKIIISTGTHTAVPMVYIGHLFGSKIIYIETFANLNTRTLAGAIVYPVVDDFIVQWEDMKALYEGSIYGGWIY